MRAPSSRAGTPLYTIVDDSVFEFRSSVASGDFGKVKVGETVNVTLDALPGFSVRGRSKPHRSAG